MEIVEKFSEIDADMTQIKIELKSQVQKNSKDIEQLKMTKYEFNKGKILEEGLEKIISQVKNMNKELKDCVYKVDSTFEDILLNKIMPLEDYYKSQGDIILQIKPRLKSVETRLENISFFKPSDDNKGTVDKERLKSLEERFREFKK